MSPPERERCQGHWRGWRGVPSWGMLITLLAILLAQSVFDRRSNVVAVTVLAAVMSVFVVAELVMLWVIDPRTQRRREREWEQEQR